MAKMGDPKLALKAKNEFLNGSKCANMEKAGVENGQKSLNCISKGAQIAQMAKMIDPKMALKSKNEMA